MSDPSTPARLLYGVSETSRVLSVGRSTVYELLRDGDLPSIRVRGRRLIAAADIAAFVDRQRTSSRG